MDLQKNNQAISFNFYSAKSQPKASLKRFVQSEKEQTGRWDSGQEKLPCGKKPTTAPEGRHLPLNSWGENEIRKM